MSIAREQRQGEIEREQLAILYTRAPAIYAVNFIVSIFTAAALWGAVSHAMLLAWAAAMTAITVWRVHALFVYRKEKEKRIRHWQRFVTLGSGISGLLWGAAALLLFPPHDILRDTFLIIVMCGMLAGAVSSWAAYMPAFRAYFLSAGIPLLLRFILETASGGDAARFMLALGTLFALYLCALYFFAMNGGRFLLESLRIKFENLDLSRSLLAISECNKIMVRANAELELLHDFCSILVEVGGYRLAWVGFALHDPEKSIVPMASFGEDENYVARARLSWSVDSERGRGPSGTAVRTRTPVVIDDAGTDPAFAPWREDAIARGYASIISLPLLLDGAPLGVLNIYAAEKNAFDDKEKELLIQLSLDLAFGIQSLRTRAEMARRAWHDPLTGLPNRTLLHDRLSQAMAAAKRNGSMLAVLFLDLDEFKEVNDKYGHAAGDELIREMSGRFLKSVREGDTVSRLGGDEFVILLDLASIAELEPCLARIMQEIVNPVALDGNVSVSISSSIGVTLYPQNDSDPEALLRHADLAMYQAKQAGRNRYRIFDIDMDQSARLDFRMKERLAAALEAQEFRLHYQPKVNLRTGRVFGVEALVRWQHPERGLLSPLEFLPFMEGSELIVRLGDWVIHEALRQYERWREAGLQLSVSVNVASEQLHEADFPRKLRDQLAPFEHPLIELEILENTALQDLQFVKRILAECKAQGVMLSLDDFGTGYSSLAYLKHLPVDILKIDQSFVRDMIDDRDDLAIIEGVISMAKIFGKDLIAEGVESEEHGRMLLALGCEKAQGYGIARPMPAEAVAAWVENWHSRT